MRYAIFVAAITLLAITSASAGQLTNCAPPSGYVSLETRADMPPPLQDRFKYFAMPDESFNESDVGAPGQGVLSIWRGKRRWILETGHGGIALQIDVVAFDVSADGKTAVLLPRLKEDAFGCDAMREYTAMRRTSVVK